MKNFPKLSVIIILLGLLMSYGCKKEEVSVDACSANATLVSNAATAFSSSPTKANCEAYLASLTKYLDSCPGLTTAQRNEYRADIASTKCN